MLAIISVKQSLLHLTIFYYLTKSIAHNLTDFPTKYCKNVGGKSADSWTFKGLKGLGINWRRRNYKYYEYLLLKQHKQECIIAVACNKSLLSIKKYNIQASNNIGFIQQFNTEKNNTEQLPF